MQQSLGGTEDAREEVDLIELINDVLATACASFHQHGVMVEHRFNDVPAVITGKYKLMGILMNLISNAVHALDASDVATRKLSVHVGQRDDRVILRVRDNGIGIPEPDMVRIISRGFTTKPGRRGFGLHRAALMAKELRGSLVARSEGPGRGAEFTLELPVEIAGKQSQDARLDHVRTHGTNA